MAAGKGRAGAREAVRQYFEQLWADGDPWTLETSAYDQGKYDREIEMLGGRRVGAVLELGCAAGSFTRRLAPLADRIVGVDVADAAIARARAATAPPHVEYRVADLMAFDPVAEGPWDLIVLSETIYYVGWQYPFFDVAWLARQLFESARPGGTLLMTNTAATHGHYLQQEWLLHAYRDLVLHAGFTLETSTRYRGAKGGDAFEALICVFSKPR